MPDLPDIQFSSWVPWPERTSSLERTSLQGVYLLAHFDDPPPGRASPDNPSVIYIGETTGKTMSLRKRWNAFSRGARTGSGHSGGNSYHEEFGSIREDLCVAAFPVRQFDETLQPLFIKHVERKLLLEYALEHGISPRFNKE